MAALPGDAISYLGQAGLIWYLVRGEGALSPENAFGIVATTSAVAALLQCAQLGVLPGGWSDLRTLAADCWRNGRWMLMGTLVTSILVFAGPWAIQAARGPSEFAGYSALATLLNAANPVIVSAGILIVPAVAAAAARGRQGALGGSPEASPLSIAWSAGGGYGLQGAALLSPFFLFLLIFPRTTLELFYKSDSPYVVYSGPLRFMVITYAATYLSQVLTSLLNGLEQSSVDVPRADGRRDQQSRDRGALRYCSASKGRPWRARSRSCARRPSRIVCFAPPDQALPPRATPRNAGGRRQSPGVKRGQTARPRSRLPSPPAAQRRRQEGRNIMRLSGELPISRFPQLDRLLLLVVILISGTVTLPTSLNVGGVSMLGFWTTGIAVAAWALWLLRPYFPRELAKVLLPLAMFGMYATISLAWCGANMKSFQNLAVDVGFIGFVLLTARECERLPAFARTIHKAIDYASVIAGALYTFTLLVFGAGVEENPGLAPRPFALFCAVAVGRQLARWQGGDIRGFFISVWLVVLIFLSQSRMGLVACVMLFPLSMCARGNAQHSQGGPGRARRSGGARAHAGAAATRCTSAFSAMTPA